MTLKASNGETINFLQTLPTGTGPFPCMIFLHGIGERGNDLSLVAKFGPPAILPPGFIILSPQLPLSKGYWEPWIIDEMVAYAKTLKPATLILTGLSLGGGATLAYASEHPDLFSCIAPMCPACLYDYQKLKNIANLPCWAFVGDKDEIVGPTCTTQIQGPMPKAKVTIIPGGDHGSAWMHGYALDSGLYAWMLAQYKPVPNPPTPIPVPTPTPPIPTPVPVPVPTPPPKPTLVKIPIDIRRMYQKNNFDVDLSGLFDGTLTQRVTPGYGQELNPYEAIYEFPDSLQAVIYKFRFYDGEGSYNTPLRIYGMAADYTRTLLAEFKGENYMTWTEVNVTNPVQYKWMVLVITYEWGAHTLPTELELWGTFKAVAEPPITLPPSSPFKNYLGVNCNIWNLNQPPGQDAWDCYQPYEPKWELMKHFHFFRQYLGWDMIEADEGMYCFQPSKYGNNGQDLFLKRCASEGRGVHFTLKNTPAWIGKDWPADQFDPEGAPRRFGTTGKKPEDYIEYARTWFQCVARWGGNKNVDPALVRGFTYNNKEEKYYPETTKVIGLGYITHAEILNEMDAWWNNRIGYMSDEEYGALLSAVWDGDKGRLGPGVGIKNADPNIKLVIAGVAHPFTDWQHALLDWWKKNRGDEFPGIFNYHLYSNNAESKQRVDKNGAVQGVSPENGRLLSVADNFNFFRGDREVWQTEFGYDLAQTSPQNAKAIGNRTVLQTQADWIVRTALCYSAKRHNRLYFYEMYDNNGGGDIFGTCGVANWGITPRPALYFIAQMGKLLGDWSYAETLYDMPRVDRYTLDGKDRFVAWYPTEEGTLKAYVPELPNRLFKTKVYILQDNSFDWKENSTEKNESFLIGETPLVYEIVKKDLITEVNYLPVADAGKDIEGTAGKTITLSAIDSLDFDGKVVAWKWRKIKGPSKGKISYSTRQTTTLTGLVAGTYVFELTVWDDNNGEATDQVTVNVK
jgi:pimeloyl-ACP methyl ester carboxylesterase